MFWKRSRPLQVAEAFLRKNGLKNRQFTLVELLSAAKQAVADESDRVLLEKPFTPSGPLRGLVVRDDDLIMIRYPKGDMVTFTHELAHILLGHQLQSPETALKGCIYTDREDQEAEEFADHVLGNSGLAYMRNEAIPHCTPEMSEFITTLGTRED